MTPAKVPSYLKTKQARDAYVAAYNAVIDKGGSDRAARIAAEKEGKRMEPREAIKR
jgi:hypothetical protein